EPVRQWNRSHPFPVSSTGPTIGEEKAKVKENFEGAVSVFASPPTALGLALFIVGSCRNDLRVLAFDFAELLRSNETDATASGLRQQHPGDLLHGIQVRNAAVVICGTLAHLERNARGRRDSTAEYFLFRHTESTPHNSPFTSDTQRCSFFRSAILYTNGNHRFLFLRSRNASERRSCAEAQEERKLARPKGTRQCGEPPRIAGKTCNDCRLRTELAEWSGERPSAAANGSRRQRVKTAYVVGAPHRRRPPVRG